jgi:hypothetical protein
MNISIEKLAQDKALAEALSASQFAKGMSPADILFAHYAVGAPRGWNMAQTIQNTHLMRGNKLSEHAAVQWADVLGSGLVEELEYTAWTPERVSLRVKRKGLKAMSFSWTMDQAKRANLANSNTWRQYPERMLAARLHTEVASVLFPDIVCQTSGANTYSTEEAAFFDAKGRDEDKVAETIGVPELAPTEESAPPRPAPAPAPKKTALDELRERLADMGIPNDDARVYLQGKGIAPPKTSDDVEAIIDEHFNIDAPFFTLHPHLLGESAEPNFEEL